MPRSRTRQRRSSGKSDSDKSESMRYTGRSSWPIVEWFTKHELSKLGLPGSIVLHEISRPATAPSTAAASAATSTRTSTSTPTSTPSTVAATAATAPQESKSADGVTPADVNDLKAQLQALQSQLLDLQTPTPSADDPDDDDDQQVDMTQIANSISQLGSSLQNVLASLTPTTPGSSGTRTTTSLSDTMLDAALNDAGDRYKKIKQLEQLVRTYRPEDFNAASLALQRQLWTMANKQVYNHIKGVLGYKHRALIMDVDKDDGLAAWDRLKMHHNNRTVSTRAKLHEDYTNMTFDTPTRCRNFTEYKQALKDKGNDFFESCGEHIDASLTHSKYLALPERYSEIKKRLTNLDEESLRKGEPPLSLKDIESLVCSWEERDYVQPFLKAAISAIAKGRGNRGSANATSDSRKDQICFNFQKGKCNRGDKCPYKHELASKSTGDRNNGGGRKRADTSKPWTKEFGPCRHCGGDHWNKDCPEPDKKKSGSANATKANDNDDSGSSSEELDYKACKALYKKAIAQRDKSRGSAHKVAWYNLTKKKKKKSSRSLVSSSTEALEQIALAKSKLSSHALIGHSGNDNDIWVLDSAASWHYATGQTALDNKRPSPHTVVPYDGAEMKAMHEGDIGPFTAVPAFEKATVNLASTGHIADEFGLATIYTGDRAFLVPESELHLITEFAMTIAHRRGPGELYLTDTASLSTAVSSLCSSEDDHVIYSSDSSVPDIEGGTSSLSLPDTDFDLDDHAFSYHDNRALDKCITLHCRLGHMHPDKMIIMHNQGIDLGLKVTLDQLKKFRDYWCPVCALSKITRLPYPKKTTKPRCSVILGVIHTDTQGKHKPKSIRGYRYIQDYLDEATRWLWISLMKNKDDLPNQMTTMERKMAIQARDSTQAPPPGHQGLRVLKYRTDNAGEVTGKKAQERMMRKLIDNDRTTPGESNQLALAERYQRHILDGTRVLMTDAQLQPHFWCYAAQHFCHIYNRSPHKSNPDNKSPYEMWYGKSPPKLTRLRTFGADCVVHTPVKDRVNKSKLDAAGVPAKYLGVPPNKEGGHLVYIPSKRAVFVRRNVLFQEDMERARGPLMDKTALRQPPERSGNSAERSDDSADLSDDTTDLSDDSAVRSDNSAERSDNSAACSEHSENSAACSDSDNDSSSSSPSLDDLLSSGSDSAAAINDNKPGDDESDNSDMPEPVDIEPDSDDDFIEMSDSPFSDEEDHVDHNDGWNQLYTTTGKNERMRDIADAHGVDLDDLILHNKMDGQLLSGRTRLLQGTEIWLPDDDLDLTSSSSDTDSEDDNDDDDAPPTPAPEPFAALLAAPLEALLEADPVDEAAQEFYQTAHEAIVAAMIGTQQGDSPSLIRKTYQSQVQHGYTVYNRAQTAGWAHLVEELRHLKARDIPTPKNYRQAMASNFKTEWQEAIRKEIQNLDDHGTWEWTDLPKGRKPIDSTWSFKVKPNNQGQIDKFKARLCARGFREIYGVDYIETHAPVTTLVCFRVCLADAAQHGYHFSFFDISGAYLKSKLMEEIYMTPPEGVEAPPDTVAHLLKALYGLKQSGRSWYGELTDILVEQLHFDRAASDACLFIITVKFDNGEFIRLNVHVDDCAATYKTKEFYQAFMRELERILRKHIKSDGSVLSISDDQDVYLGMTVERLPDGAIKLHQARYTEDILARFNHLDASPASTPYLSGDPLCKEDAPKTEEERKEVEGIPYKSLVGSVLHLSRSTRPDISCAVAILAKYQKDPGPRHWNAAKKLLRYLAGTRDYGIIYGRDRTEDGIPHSICHGWTDSDYAGDLDRRRSRSGYVYYSWGGPVSWSSALQGCVALSSCQAEYQAACEAAKEAIWLIRVCNDLGYTDLSIETHGKLTQKEYEGKKPLTIFEDNQGCIELSKNPVHHKRSKHIETKYHFVRDEVLKGTIKLVKTHTDDNISDIFTKALDRATFVRHRDKLVAKD